MTKLEALQHHCAQGASVAAQMLERGEVVPSGIFDLDWYLLGVGGVPTGRVCEFFGEEGSGKSTTAFMFAASAQRTFTDKLVGVVDTEGKLHDASGVRWPVHLGVNSEELVVYSAGHIEDVFNRVRGWVDSGDFSLIVVDSVAHAYPEDMVPGVDAKGKLKSEDGWGGFRRPGAEARAVGEFVKWLADTAARTKVSVILINQIRDKLKIGWSPTSSILGQGETYSTPGGHGLRHAAALRMQFSRKGPLVEGSGRHETVRGFCYNINVRKCQFAPDGRRTGNDTGGPVEVDAHVQPAIDNTASVVWGAAQFGVVEARGAWYSWESQGLKVQGLENFAQEVVQRGLVDQLAQEVIARVKVDGWSAGPPSNDWDE